MDFSLALEILGFTVGLVYLWFEYHADKRVWITSMIMPMISMWIYFSKGLYADFSINIYYLVIAVYGYAMWTRKGRGASPKEKQKEKGGVKITHTPLWGWVVVAVGLGALWTLLWWLLTLTDSTVPVADAFTTALSIVGMWMLARKFAEQWLAWFVVDVVCVWLYIYKGIYFYAALYGIYTVISLFGYAKWLRLMKEGK